MVRVRIIFKVVNDLILSMSKWCHQVIKLNRKKKQNVE